MPFRVTNIQTTFAFVEQMFKQRAALEDARQQVASGLKVVEPSDDPARAATIIQFQSTLSRLERQKQRIASVTGVLETQESALNNAESLMLRANELAQQGANGTSSVEARRAMSAEIFQIRDTLVSIANTKYQGAYIFGGAADGTQPFSASTYAEPVDPANPAHIRYVWAAANGSDQTRDVQVSDSDSVKISANGDAIFSNAISSLERLGRALDGYRTDPEDASTLPTGTGAAFVLPAEFDEQTTAIRNTLDLIGSARATNIVLERTSLGSRLNRVENARQLIEAVQSNTEKSRSSIQDADIVEAASQFANLQTGLQGLLASGAQINQLSILNFL